MPRPAKVRRQRPRNGVAHSLLATTKPLPTSAITQPTPAHSTVNLSQHQLHAPNHTAQHLRNQLSDPLTKQRVPSELPLALRQQQAAKQWRSSSRAAPTPSPPSSKATRTSRRNARTAATSARESTSAGCGSRSASSQVRVPRSRQSFKTKQNTVADS